MSKAAERCFWLGVCIVFRSEVSEVNVAAVQEIIMFFFDPSKIDRFNWKKHMEICNRQNSFEFCVIIFDPLRGRVWTMSFWRARGVPELL